MKKNDWEYVNQRNVFHHKKKKMFSITTNISLPNLRNLRGLHAMSHFHGEVTL